MRRRPQIFSRPFARCARPAAAPAAGFTLIELLVVIAVVGVLAAIIIPTLGAARAQARAVKEMSALRQLMVGYHMHAEDNRGRLLAQQSNRDTDRVTTEGGQSAAENSFGGNAAVRWPHRLRPYLGNRFKATLFVNDQELYYDHHVGPAGGGDYYISMGPTFGINSWFVGDVAYHGYPKQVRAKAPPVTSLARARMPSRLITFVSATNRSTKDEASMACGYFYVHDPKLGGWPAADIDALDPKKTAQDRAYGQVAFRVRGKAGVAFLDGHVERKSCAELRDMRLWSEAAALADDPNFDPR